MARAVREAASAVKHAWVAAGRANAGTRCATCRQNGGESEALVLYHRPEMYGEHEGG